MFLALVELDDHMDGLTTAHCSRAARLDKCNG